MRFLGTQNQILHYFQSEVDIPSKMDILDLYHVMKLQNFLSSGKFHTIQNESEFDDINIEVRNLIKLNFMGYESKVYEISLRSNTWGDYFYGQTREP